MSIIETSQGRMWLELWTIIPVFFLVTLVGRGIFDVTVTQVVVLNLCLSLIVGVCYAIEFFIKKAKH